MTRFIEGQMPNEVSDERLDYIIYTYKVNPPIHDLVGICEELQRRRAQGTKEIKEAFEEGKVAGRSEYEAELCTGVYPRQVQEWIDQAVAEAQAELKLRRRQGTKLKELVNAQAEDEGLWFLALTASEAHLQTALRDLHAAIEYEINALEK